MGLGSALANVAKVVISNLEIGEPVTLRRVTLGAYNTATGKPGSVSSADEALTLVVSWESEEGEGQVEKRKATVEIPAASLAGAAPKEKDRLVISGAEHEITGVEPTIVGNVAVLYTVKAGR